MACVTEQDKICTEVSFYKSTLRFVHTSNVENLGSSLVYLILKLNTNRGCGLGLYTYN